MKLLKSEKGQAMVELAITLPILLVLLCGILDFGWIYSNKLIISNSSREGARAAVVAGGVNVEQTVDAHVRSSVPQGMRDSVVVDFSLSDLGEASVTVSDRVAILTPIGGMFFGGQDVNISSTTVMLAG